MKIQRAMIRRDIVDPDPLMDSQIFDTRKDFLTLCQQNRYQFDELRRAKVSFGRDSCFFYSLSNVKN